MAAISDGCLLHAQHHSIINSTCAGNEMSGAPDFYIGSIQLSFYMMQRCFLSECCYISVKLHHGFAL